MRQSGSRVFRLLCVLFWAAASHGAVAQEGHPLTGTWAGDFGPNETDRTRITLVMEWDGKTLSGTINPGPNAVSLAEAALDVTSWTLRFRAEAKDASGKPILIEAEGRIEDLGSWHRRLVGTWTQGGTTGDFRLSRQ